MFRNSIPIIPRIIHLSETLLDYSVIESRYEKKKKKEGREFHEFFPTFKNSFVLEGGKGVIKVKY